MDMEEGFRRGSVLGLTIAEIFILLVFLMLLALMGVNRYWGEKTEGWKDIIENNSPEDVEHALGHPDSLRAAVLGLKDQIQSLLKEKERLQKRIRVLEDREGETGERLDRATEKLEEVDKALDEHKKALEEAKHETTKLKTEKQELSDSRNHFKSKVDSLDNKIRIMHKGITPPCWYQLVEETNPITKANWREKTYYLFDIAIRDDHMEVQSLPIPAGGAEDDGGLTYVEESKGLALDAIPYGIPLTDMEVRRFMRPLYEKAKGSKVRTYSCIFYVRVWDETASGAKERWKQAHDGVLEQLFGTHQVRSTSWMDRGNLPVNVRVLDAR